MTKQQILSEKPSILWVSNNLLEERIQPFYYKAIDIKEIEKITNFPKVKKLGELTNLVTDGTHQTPQYVRRGEGVRFVTSKNITEYEVSFETDNDITVDQHKKLQKTQPISGDILMTKIGSRIGVSKVVPDDAPEFNIFVSLALLRIKQEEIFPYYLETFLNSKYGSLQAYRLSKGITQLDFHLGDIKNVFVPIPSREIQHFIGGKILKAEQLRIEAKRHKDHAESLLTENLKLALLEQGIRKIKKYNWMELNEDRLDLKFNHPAMQKIKDHLMTSTTKKLSEVADINGGFAFPSEVFNNKDGQPVIKIAEIDIYNIDYDNLSKVDYNIINSKKDINKYLCHKGDLLYAMTGATLGKTAMNIGEPLLVNQRVAMLRTKGVVPNGFLLVYLNSLIGRHFSNLLNTGVAQPNISADDMGEFIVPILEDKIMEEIHNSIVTSLESEIMANNLIRDAKNSVESLIEGTFDDSKIKEEV